MKSLRVYLLAVAFLLLSAVDARAALRSGFDAINFDPAIDDSPYFTVYGSQTRKAWQGTLGFYFDYANRPLEFRTVGGTTSRQSVLEQTFIIDAYGSLGFTDWFTAGINIPAVPFNEFFTPDAAALEDSGGGMGDIMVITKFRILDVDRHGVGFAAIPYATLPTGDVVRYNGNGHVTGGLKLVVDFEPSERISIAANLGGVLRDDVTQNSALAGGATASIRIDDLFTYGLGMNIRFSKYIQGIIEGQGYTLIRDFFGSSNTTSVETGAGARFFIGDSGFAVTVGGTAGLIEGVGTPRFRGVAGLRWTSPIPKPCPEPVPDRRIKGNRIVLWGKIFFDTAKWTIKPISYPVLDDVVDVLQKNPGITLVEVQGHTDSRGTDAYNMRLSQRRAEAARQYLINKGISPSRLRAVGYGERRPIAPNDTVEGMSQNRRTEFVIIQSTEGHVTHPNPSDVTVPDSTAETGGVDTVPVSEPETPGVTPGSGSGETYPVTDDEGNPL